MNDKKDEFKECIAREFEEIAREEEEFLENDTSLIVPEGTKEAVLARVKEQIRVYQQEQAEKEAREREEAVSHLSEEDRKALELGRKMLKAEIGQSESAENENKEKRHRHRKKPLKLYLVLAAVIVCVMAMGITSMGGPERVVRMMTQAVGNRDVEYSATGKKIKTVDGEDEEQAYQKIKDIFGVDAVKVSSNLKNMKFDMMNLDEDNQTAELYYTYAGETIGYVINIPYRESSWAVDFEDEKNEEYMMEVDGCKIKITMYKTDKNGIPRWGAKFTHNSIEYLLTGAMNQEDFEKLVKNLIFPN